MMFHHIIVTPRHMFTPLDWLTWVNVGGGCYRVISEHGSPLGLDGRCVGHEFMSGAYVFLCFWSIYWLCMHGVGYGCSGVAM